MTATHTTPHSTASSTRTIAIKITRQDRPESAPYIESFQVPYKANLNVISCLQWIAANPTTTEGKPTTTPVWEAACLEEVCGSCTMLINGHARQACSALIDPLLDESAEITLEPMSKFPVVRDLVVNRQRFFDDLIKIKAWVPIDGTHFLGAGPKEQPPAQDTRYALSRCMTCGCCLEACPQYTVDNNFLGPAIFSQVRYFNMHKTGKVLAGDRLEVVEGPGGITDCGNAQNCVKVCPKEIPLTESIGELGREATIHAIKKFFTGS